MFDFDGFFGRDLFAGLMLPVRGVSGFLPVAVPVTRANTMFPSQLIDLLTTQPGTGRIGQGTSCECGCGKKIAENTNTEIDELMSKRRELNALMRVAVENEEFEKAAELRDKIKELEVNKTKDATNPAEAGRSTKCDSETSSQDSQPVQ